MRIVTQLGHVRKLDFEGICIGSKVFLLSGELLHHIPVATGRQQPYDNLIPTRRLRFTGSRTKDDVTAIDQRLPACSIPPLPHQTSTNLNPDWA
jgi:hypothetical protein